MSEFIFPNFFKKIETTGKFNRETSRKSGKAREKNQRDKSPAISSTTRVSNEKKRKKKNNSLYFRPGTFINRNINYRESFRCREQWGSCTTSRAVAIRQIDVIPSDCAH